MNTCSDATRHITLEIPPGIKLVDVCEFARANGCRVQRLRNGTFRLAPVTEPATPRRGNVTPIQAARR